MAAGVMYIRLLILIALFNRALLARLVLPFALLSIAGLAGGWLWTRRPDASPDAGHVAGNDRDNKKLQAQNPLELSAAFVFAFLFFVLLAATHYATLYLGRGSIYGLAAITGVSDVAPFILGMAQSAGTSTPLGLAAGGILIAAASNNAAKGFYALSFGNRKTGRQSLALLLVLTVLGLLPLLF